jgi:hypothetical protein
MPPPIRPPIAAPPVAPEAPAYRARSPRLLPQTARPRIATAAASRLIDRIARPPAVQGTDPLTLVSLSSFPEHARWGSARSNQRLSGSRRRRKSMRPVGPHTTARKGQRIVRVLQEGHSIDAVATARDPVR